MHKIKIRSSEDDPLTIFGMPDGAEGKGDPNAGLVAGVDGDPCFCCWRVARRFRATSEEPGRPKRKL